MIKPKEITVSISKKIGMPNYSSINLMASTTYTVDDGEDLLDAYSRAWNDVKDQIDIQEESLPHDPNKDPKWMNDDKAAGVQRTKTVSTEPLPF